PYAHYLSAGALFREGSVDGALREYFAAYRASTDTELDSLIIASLRETQQQFPDKVTAAAEAETLSGPRRQTLSAALGASIGRGAGTVRELDASSIVMALPLSGRLQSYGERIERGAQLALDQRAAESAAHRLQLQAFDTHGSPVEAARIVQRAQDQSALALIGPLTSEEAAAVSAALRCGELAALAPAASQSAFTELSDHMFQMTPSPAMIGRFLAEYAYLGMPVATAAALAPNSETEREMAEAFVERFEALGGQIIAFDIFPERATDFGNFARTIKNRYLQYYQENATLITTEGDTLELDEVPVSVGCVFIPATASQLQLILPQINYHNITTTLIGADGMASPSVWELKLQNVDRIVFTSLLTNDPGNEVYRDFAEAYRDRFGEAPDRLAALGYDAAQMIIDAVRGGSTVTDAVARALADSGEREGASGWIKFGPDRINRAVALFSVVDGIPLRVSWTAPTAQR
ncbi:MAG TPA: penicillin-binding protein activator, partial [candidate division Zixibacteria bacterium]|nr:penicillin-binding protein activator [candidate division Zixibacteria bacterium]